MTAAKKHISVCICTFRRPNFLGALLSRLEQQQTNDRFTYSIIVADNDAGQTSHQVVSAFAGRSTIAITYSCEARQNISLARNEVLRHATGEFVAFIDDDELPEIDWLATMLQACEMYAASGVLGPVRPHFEEPPPRWVIDGRFCERPEYATGHVMDWPDCKTGNVLLRRSILAGLPEVFDPIFGSGSEDQDFFRRMMGSGHVFVWCNEGAVYETVPKERCKRTYMLRRAMLRGRNSLNVPVGRVSRLARSVAAVPAYLLILPFALFMGQHVFMRYCIRLCDHAGRLLALVRLNPVHRWS
jgi:glycosyltransferase involved in cell wall biosynthesis